MANGDKVLEKGKLDKENLIFPIVLIPPEMADEDSAGSKSTAFKCIILHPSFMPHP